MATTGGPKGIEHTAAMADEDSEYPFSMSFPNNQAIHWPSSDTFQLETTATPRWPLSAFHTSVATAGSNQTQLNLDDHGFPVDTPSAGIQNDETSTRTPLDDVRNSTATSIARSSAYATGEDWTKHRPSIRKLYVDEKRTLADVMHIMESRHGFKATKKMYKSRITQWNLDKKHKANEMRAVARKRRLRKDQGKLSIFRVRGRSVDSDEEVRYWHRKGVTVDDVIAQRTMSRTPEAVQVFSRIHSPVSTPAELATPERIFRRIQDYIAGSFEAGTWVRTDPRSFCYSTKANRSAYSSSIITQCLEACELFSRNRFQEGGRILLAATAGLKNVVSAERPLLLVELCLTTFYIRQRRMDEVAMAILRQVSGLSGVLLAGKHPLRHICAWLSSVDSSQFEDTIYRCVQSIGDQFESLLGLMHVSALHHRLTLCELRRDEGATTKDILQDLLDKCEMNLGFDDNRSLEVRDSLICYHLRRGNYIEALKMSQELYAYCQQSQPTTHASLFGITVLEHMAECQYALGQVHLAIANLREAIHLRTSACGRQDWLARSWLLGLEDWFLEQGQPESANEVRAEREKMLELLELD